MLLANTGLSDCGILTGYSGESWAFTRHLNSQQECWEMKGMRERQISEQGLWAVLMRYC